jgi:hypothetical protein
MTPSLSPSIVMACTMFVPLPAVKILQTGIFSVKLEKSTGLDSLRRGGIFGMLIGPRTTLICFFVRIVQRHKFFSSEHLKLLEVQRKQCEKNNENS